MAWTRDGFWVPMLWLGLLLWTEGCVHAPQKAAPPHTPRAHLGLGNVCGAPVFLTAPHSMAAAERDWVRAALPGACKRLREYALHLRLPTELRLHGSRDEFRAATHKRASWLRAWAGFRVVHLMPPSAWRDRDAEAHIERLAHELSHVALFQYFVSEEEARTTPLPPWFLEGAASWVAGQGARRMPVEEVCRRSGDKNPLITRELWRKDHQLLYGAGHAALMELVRTHGKSIISRLVLTHLARENTTQPFAVTLNTLTGQSPHSLWRALCFSVPPSAAEGVPEPT